MGDWTASAACLGQDTNQWFPGSDLTHQLDAHKTCYTCPVKQSCALAAWEAGEEYGIWGGIKIGSENWERNLRTVAGVPGDYCNGCNSLLRPPKVKAADHPGKTRVNATECMTCYSARTGRKPQGRKTHCHQGHEFTDETTYTRPRDGRRECKICRREREAA